MAKEQGGPLSDQDTQQLLVKNLAKITDVPEHQVLPYVETRSNRSRHQLQSLLQSMPGTDFSTSSGGQASASSSSPPKMRRASTAGPSKRQEQKQQIQARIAGLSAGLNKTAYHGQFGESAAAQLDRDIPSHHAFKGVVKTEYQPQLEDWKRSASESDIHAFAESCRQLRTFKNPATWVTTHNRQMVPYPDYRPPAMIDRTGDRNASKVPLGCIDPKAASKSKHLLARDVLHKEHLEQARNIEEMWMDGEMTNEALQKSLGTMHHTVQGSTLNDDAYKGPSNSKDWKSAMRSSFATQQHTAGNRARMDMRNVGMGERGWKEAQHSSIFKAGTHAGANAWDTLKMQGQSHHHHHHHHHKHHQTGM